jgi:hypothetical protein
MYCSTCGTQISDGISYCNRCGKPTETIENIVNYRPMGLMVCGASFIAIVGLGGLIPLLRILLESRLETSAVAALVLIYLTTVFLLFTVMMGMAWKVTGIASTKKRKKDDEKYKAPAAFRGAATGQLYPGDQGFASVTDSTTRTLDEAFAERKR